MSFVYLHGSYFGKNFGDVLLVDIFAARIKKLGFSVILPFADKFYEEEVGCSVGRPLDESEIVYAVFCGGGYFGEPGTRKRYWSLRNSYRHGRAYFLFRKKKIPYGIFGVGFGPITHQPFLGIAKKIFLHAQYACVRDIESFRFLEAYGVARSVDVFADAVMTLRASDIPEAEVAKEITFKRDNNFDYFIGVHLTNKYDDSSAFDKIKKALVMFASRYGDAKFVFISDGKSRTGRKLQQEIDALVLSDALPQDRVIHACYKSHWQMVALINKLDMIVTSKLHVGIVSSSLERNVISIPYHSKTVRFYRQIKQEDRCLVGELEVGSVFDLLSAHYGSAGVVIPDDVRRNAERNFEVISGALAKVDGSV